MQAALLLALASPLSAFALDDARIELPRADQIRLGGKPAVPGLTWLREELEIKSGYSRGGANHYVIVEGRYDRKGWKLFYQLNWQKKPNPLIIEPGKPFSFEVPYTGVTTPFQVIAVSSSGTAQNQTFYVKFPEDKRLEKPSSYSPGLHRITPSVGLTQSWYTQSNGRSITQTLLTFKTGYTFLIAPPRWDIGAGFYFSALPLKTSVADQWARFLGINVRIGFNYRISQRWTGSFSPGVYYTTMIISKTSRLGFENLMGPQLFTTIRYQLGSRDGLAIYLKLCPVGTGFQLSSLSDRETATGLAWTHTLQSGRPVSFSIDAADLSLTLTGVQIKSKSISVSSGFGF